VADAAIVLQAIAGYDLLDVNSANVPASDYVSGLPDGVEKLRVGVPRSYFFDDLDDEVRLAVEKALGAIAALVAEIRDVHLEVSSDRIVQAAESYAYHAENVARTPELYQPETLRRIRSGEKILAAEYIRRHREMDEQRRSILDIFSEVDLLVTPTTPIPAPAIADLKKDPAALRPAELTLLRNTRPFNVWGLPAISLLCGFTKGGLPVGLQIAGAPWREDLVLRLASAYEFAGITHADSKAGNVSGRQESHRAPRGSRGQLSPHEHPVGRYHTVRISSRLPSAFRAAAMPSMREVC
jgi:Asp-tRNA(Asn)/Glu-tRNA(Gln) amidotransferase A subunit family amidase